MGDAHEAQRRAVFGCGTRQRVLGAAMRERRLRARLDGHDAGRELHVEALDDPIAAPDVASVSSFIGPDGTNPTANTGRFSIALVSMPSSLSSSGTSGPVTRPSDSA